MKAGWQNVINILFTQSLIFSLGNLLADMKNGNGDYVHVAFLVDRPWKAIVIRLFAIINV